MNRFELRKKLLVAESEVYRELLKMELQTFKVYTRSATQKLSSPSNCLPLLMAGMPMLTKLFAKKKGKSPASSWQRLASLVMLGWKTYQRFGSSFGASTAPPPAQETEAEEYLSRRL